MSKHLPIKMRFKRNSTAASGEGSENSNSPISSPSSSDNQLHHVSSAFHTHGGLLEPSTSSGLNYPMFPASSSRNMSDQIEDYFPGSVLRHERFEGPGEPGPSHGSTCGADGTKTKKKTFRYFCKGEQIDLDGPLPGGAPNTQSSHSSGIGITAFSNPDPHEPMQYLPSGDSSVNYHSDHYNSNLSDYYEPDMSSRSNPSYSLFQHGESSAFHPVETGHSNYNSQFMPPNPSVKTKKRQQCRRCANHNVHVLLKGHGPICEFKNCECEKCLITKARQIAVKNQAKLTRAQEAEKTRQQFYDNNTDYHPDEPSA